MDHVTQQLAFNEPPVTSRAYVQRHMGRIHLKETPEERAERNRRKRKRAERRAANRRKSHSHTQEAKSPQEEREQAGDVNDFGYDEEDEGEGWLPPEGSIKIDIEQVRAEVEERLFKEKLFDAMGEDYEDRLDGLEAQMNTYYYVPKRWEHAHDRFGDHSMDPNQMPDEEYTEWLRKGMYRRTHKAEIEERERKEAERKARKEEQRKARQETARLELEREAERQVKHELREARRRRKAWDYYEARWKVCTATEPPDRPLKFQDIPWPMFTVPTTTEQLTTDGISVFILHGLRGDDGTTESKTRKELIREALLRWHPDKFEGKMGSRLDIRERKTVLEGVGIVARSLNELMAT